MNVSGAGYIQLSKDQIQNMDIGTLRAVIGFNRINNTEQAVRTQMQTVQGNNDRMRAANEAVAGMMELKNATGQAIKDAEAMKAHMQDYKGKNWAVGEAWPNGGKTDDSRFFEARGMTCDPYVRGNVSKGDSGAYDRNIAKLDAYIAKLKSGDAVPLGFETKAAGLQQTFKDLGLNYAKGLDMNDANQTMLKGFIDSASSTSQIEQMKLQTLNGKLSNAVEETTNGISKDEQTKKTIAGNMR